MAPKGTADLGTHSATAIFAGHAEGPTLRIDTTTIIGDTVNVVYT